MRKRAWQEREIPLKAERGVLAAEGHQRIAKRSDYTTVRLAALSEAIEGELSPHQREVLVAIALNGCRSTCSPSGSTRRGAPCTRPSAMGDRSSGPRWTLAA